MLPEINNYILYRKQWNGDKGKWEKYPISPLTKQLIDAHDISHHMSMGSALSHVSADDEGLAFVFTPGCGYFFVDIDSCAHDGSWSELATDIMSMFPGAYIETSMSGTGLHVVGRHSGAEPAHKCKNIPLDLELYTSKRFMAVGNTETAVGSSETDHSTGLSQFIAMYMSPDAGVCAAPDEGACPEWNGYKNDDRLLEVAMASKAAAGYFGGVTFKDLWTANGEKLAEKWPGNVDGYDASSADSALAQHLAFWTGKDVARIIKLMRESALYRDKWDARGKYLENTVYNVCARQDKVHRGSSDNVAPISKQPVTPCLRTGMQFMYPDQQLEYFQGCIYIQDCNKVLLPNGIMLDSSRFNATYGGYLFFIDSENDKTSKKAWEIFTESQCVDFPKAYTTCFRPDLPFGEIIERDGVTEVNRYTPVETASAAGDISPFMNHLTALLPDSRDREIILAYTAACVQHQGVKFQWAPLIQGTEGNGKTLLSRCVAFAIGKRYSHWPRADEMTEKFNTWLFGNTFIAVEDVYCPENKNGFMEILKPMITGDQLEERAMATDKVMKDCCANFILNSNHKDAILKTRKDRRFAIFFTAQQDEQDVIDSGMGDDYFPNLYRWLKKEGGYEAVNAFLRGYAIPDDLNPAAGCHRAPETSTTGEAIMQSMGRVQQEVLEAVENGSCGFKNGWVSSIWFDALLKENGLRLPKRKRRAVLQDLGYDWHPALNNGRVNNPVMTDSMKKPCLFIIKDHPASFITDSAEAARTYEEDQV